MPNFTNFGLEYSLLTFFKLQFQNSNFSNRRLYRTLNKISYFRNLISWNQSAYFININKISQGLWFSKKQGNLFSERWKYSTWKLRFFLLQFHKNSIKNILFPNVQVCQNISMLHFFANRTFWSFATKNCLEGSGSKFTKLFKEES